jgi:hypothetical protein
VLELDAAIPGDLVLCMARPEAVSQAKPGPNRPSQAGPKWRLHDGFGLAWDGEKPKPGREAAAFASKGRNFCLREFMAWVIMHHQTLIYQLLHGHTRRRSLSFFIFVAIAPHPHICTSLSTFFFAQVHVQWNPLWPVLQLFMMTMCPTLAKYF